MEYYVYVHKCPVSDEVRYVGKGKGGRAGDLASRYSHHKNWLNFLKNKKLKPIVEIIESYLTEDEAFFLENIYIKQYRNNHQKLTNITNGGEGCSGYRKSNTVYYKEKLLELARNKKPRPSNKRTREGYALTKFLNKNSGQYDEDFSKEIKAIAPHWFVKTSDINKAKIINIAYSGQDRPDRYSRFDRLITNYTSPSSVCFDYSFLKLLIEIRPDWFRADKMGRFLALK